ncbi:MAG: VWA domain-containing protein [Syntrophaceticus sp.]|nr:VWA domain-containing protein [Syntrophaceticus sp.]MDD3313953.1 VWA domain-containing protein [Syntrophaceticus sp.]MDD4359030.1 VWA domain-containing protein [Syntrophaceticus sp.]MDD4782654.1 VWA domain-containing protein [Syntrophaceticus sp.]HBG22125.1 hypothetical protein [Peptococcaceae bacterium]
MLKTEIIEFGRLLRKGGVKVSVDQISTALEAVALVGFAYEDFYMALFTILITDQMDRPLFDKLFRLYFVTAAQNQKIPTKDSQQTSIPLNLVQNIEGKGMGIGAGAAPYQLLVKAVRELNYPLLRHLAHMGIRSSVFPEREAIKEMEKLIEQVKVAVGWYMAVNKLEKIRQQESVSETVYLSWLDCLAYLMDYTESQLEDLFVKEYGLEILDEIADAANIREKDFVKLNDLQIQEIRKRISKMARKLATKYARRYRRAKHGKIDLRRTVKEALLTGGTPMRLKYRKRVISKPEMVLLCDVSGSVAHFSDFMLRLVYTIQNRFSAVRSFLFVNTIDEVTEYFKNKSIQEALDAAFAKARYAMSPFSNYGRVFCEFEEKFLSDISPQCTLIILGDARNNYNYDEKERLQKIQGCVRRVLWFNPQPQESWDTEDSIMSIYAPHCRQVFECRNLKQLEEVIETIL